jgi:hypothetical protein
MPHHERMTNNVPIDQSVELWVVVGYDGSPGHSAVAFAAHEAAATLSIRQLGSGTSDSSVACGTVPCVVAPGEGIVTVTDRPPSFRGMAVAAPPWIAAIDATMAKPIPEPVMGRAVAQALERREDAMDVRWADDLAGIFHGQLAGGPHGSSADQTSPAEEL